MVTLARPTPAGGGWRGRSRLRRRQFVRIFRTFVNVWDHTRRSTRRWSRSPPLWRAGSRAHTDRPPPWHFECSGPASPPTDFAAWTCVTAHVLVPPTADRSAETGSLPAPPDDTGSFA